MSNKSANDVLDRIQLALNAQSDNEVCQLLDIGRSTLGGWRSRDSVPYALCVELSEDKGLSLDWLLTGKGNMCNGQDKPPISTNRRLQMMIKIMEALPEKQQDKILSAAEDAERLTHLEQQISKLTERLTA